MALVVFTMIVPHNALSLSMKMHFSQFDLFNVITWGNKGLFETLLGHNYPITNTFTPYIIMSLGGLAFKNGLYIYLMRQFFKGVPDELEESAYVDGSGVFRTFFQIILPLAVPMMITVFLFSFSWQWTDEFYTELFFYAKEGMANKVYLMPDVYQVPTSLYNTTVAGAALYHNVIQNTGGMLIIMPLVILYLFCQKYLVQGIERSGLVG
jgi:multiple sugar transport system permease protein